MMIRRTLPAGFHLGQHRPLPQRHDAWRCDAMASAFAIARWEDDGGLIRAVRSPPDQPLSTDERMTPHRGRDI